MGFLDAMIILRLKQIDIGIIVTVLFFVGF